MGISYKVPFEPPIYPWRMENVEILWVWLFLSRSIHFWSWVKPPTQHQSEFAYLELIDFFFQYSFSVLSLSAAILVLSCYLSLGPFCDSVSLKPFAAFDLHHMVSGIMWCLAYIWYHNSFSSFLMHLVSCKKKRSIHHNHDFIFSTPLFKTPVVAPSLFKGYSFIDTSGISI